LYSEFIRSADKENWKQLAKINPLFTDMLLDVFKDEDKTREWGYSKKQFGSLKTAIL